MQLALDVAKCLASERLKPPHRSPTTTTTEVWKTFAKRFAPFYQTKRFLAALVWSTPVGVWDEQLHWHGQRVIATRKACWLVFASVGVGEFSFLLFLIFAKHNRPWTELDGWQHEMTGGDAKHYKRKKHDICLPKIRRCFTLATAGSSTTEVVFSQDPTWYSYGRSPRGCKTWFSRALYSLMEPLRRGCV